MKLKIYGVLLFFVLSLNFNIATAGGIEDDGSAEESKDYENVELTTREDISEFQELQEPLYEKLEEIIADGCEGETDEEIKGFLVEKYGDWILMTPPVKELTYVLWFAPIIIMAIGLIVIFRRKIAKA